tara:strand:- start:871 stop:1041 length:171 start_codon:yes stop_codon:yes gene_type:complete
MLKTALMAEYPFLDDLMAETLIKAYENGTLPQGGEEEALPTNDSKTSVLQNISVNK